MYISQTLRMMTAYLKDLTTFGLLSLSQTLTIDASSVPQTKQSDERSASLTPRGIAGILSVSQNVHSGIY